MARRIVLCFDGTWNKPADPNDGGGTETNVCRFYNALVEGPEQRAWYDAGVGTNWWDRHLGGVAGAGLSRNVREGYAKLIEVYEEGDAVFILGFSRGAYTARSLVGLIRKCGLLSRDAVPGPLVEGNPTIAECYTFYRNRRVKPDDAEAQRFRAERRAREIEIAFLGVWDTVGALGIPNNVFNSVNRFFFSFHDTELSRIARNAYHAVAVDEWRKPYEATLWAPKHKPGQVVEQRWFVGAHADVGGGYQDRRLSDITLAWMQEKAAAWGLAFVPARVARRDPRAHIDAKPTPSYALFLGGFWARLHRPYYRPVGITAFGNEIVDATVWERIAAVPSYRPKNPGLKDKLPPR